tara:strand:- start:137 stop:1336 length:1200 start_codon:yes stop_codon:yes gene_type:complete
MQWSLENIYKNQVRGKVPPRKHLRVLGEAKITLSYDEEGIDDEVIEVKDKDLRNISGYYSGDVEGSFLSKADAKIIEELAVKCGFETQFKFLKLLFTQYRVDYDILKAYVDRKDSQTVLGSEMQGAMGIVDLWEVCSPQLSFLKDPKDAPKFYNTLFTRKFEEGTVSVGAGELALAVLTEAKKATVGDLLVGNLDVEVKTGKGRVISSRNAGFAGDNRFIQQIANGGPDPVIKTQRDEEVQLDEIIWNSHLAKKALTGPNLQKYVIDKTDDPKKRLAYIGALLTYAYGGHGNPEAEEETDKHGFDIILAIFQKTKKVAGEDRMQQRAIGPSSRPRKREVLSSPGTFYNANYINVRDINTVIAAVDQNLLEFGFGGEGVYINYPGAGNLSSKITSRHSLV